MVKEKLLVNSLEGRNAYGAFLEEHGTKVELVSTYVCFFSEKVLEMVAVATGVRSNWCP